MEATVIALLQLVAVFTNVFHVQIATGLNTITTGQLRVLENPATLWKTTGEIYGLHDLNQDTVISVGIGPGLDPRHLNRGAALPISTRRISHTVVQNGAVLSLRLTVTVTRESNNENLQG